MKASITGIFILDELLIRAIFIYTCSFMKKLIQVEDEKELELESDQDEDRKSTLKERISRGEFKSKKIWKIQILWT